MDETKRAMARQIARMTGDFQRQRTGRAPRAVTVVLGGDTLVSTLHEALTPAEQALARSPAGAARVREYHRKLFADSVGPLRQEILKITGMEVREAVVEVEPMTGTLVHVFSSDDRVQVFRLPGGRSEEAEDGAAPGDEEMDQALNAFELAVSNLALAMGRDKKEPSGGREEDRPDRM
jgi:uncharacterized protein YbcI